MFYTFYITKALCYRLNSSSSKSEPYTMLYGQLLNCTNRRHSPTVAMKETMPQVEALALPLAN